MPFDAGWGSLKIVAPLAPDRQEEIAGGLRNALERGETLAKAKQSFLSAGYKLEEINAAVQKIPATTSQIGKPIPATTKTPAPAKTKIPAIQQPAAKPGVQTLPTTTAIIPGQKQKLSKKFIIILVSISVLILTGAALLGFFWK